MEDDRPTAGRGDQEENEEDALPDWRLFAKFANRKEDGAVLVPFIPKRGEKDFEPIPLSSSLPPSSKEATLSQHQLNTLQESRSALFAALSTGSRHHSSRGYNSFTWRPDLDGGRATCDGPSAYGVHFLNLGKHHPERKQLELLPEEALYMVERGAIELWREGEQGEEGSPTRVPMSVQQAWAEIIGHDGLTVERFQVYAYLKRLGYVLSRARVPASASPQTPTTTATVSSRSLLQLLSLPFSTFRDLVFAFARSLRAFLPTRIRLTVTRTLKSNEGRLASMVTGRRWSSYDQIFGRLQFIPSGHDASLPRGPEPRTPSILTPLAPVPASVDTPNLPSLEEHPYQTFFHLYKPVTKYRKSAPPPPDFRVVVINAATTSLPDLFELTSMFTSVPFSLTEDTLLPPPRPIRVGIPPPAPNPRYRPRPLPPPPNLLERFLAYVPFTSSFSSSRQKPRKPPPYPRLKTGRRSILVAVVDNGTVSTLRFSETEFAKLPWNGVGRRK